MPFYGVQRMENKETKEEIDFSSADLIIDDSGAEPYWNVHVTTMDPDNYFEKRANGKEEFRLVFQTEHNQTFEGKVLISNISMDANGSLIELVGKGKLEGDS